MAMMAAVSAVTGQSGPIAAARFDPSDVYFQAYLAVRSAEELEAAQDFPAALAKLERASQLFNSVRQYHPEWKPEMVGGRSEKTTETIARIRPLAEGQILKNRNAVAELEGGVRAPVKVNPAKPTPPTPPPPTSILEVDPNLTRRLDQAEQEVQRLRSLADRQQNSDVTAKQNLSQISRQRDELAARLRSAEASVETLRSRLLAAPVESELTNLNHRIEALEQEKSAMAMALAQSRGAHVDATTKISTLEADLAKMSEKYSTLRQEMETERKVANSVVHGQRRQLDALERELADKNTELTAANQKISNLIAELDQSREAFTQLRDERDSLVRERDQMAALLQLNEGNRIQDLIEQNIGLAKNLREANDKVDRLHRENNANQDAYNDALRDLAIAKTQINHLHTEKRDQERRLAELETRLKEEEKSLAAGKVEADVAEIQTLRDIIHRQLRLQERRRQARDLLIEAAADLGAKDERLAQAIELFNAQEIALTPEEQKLIANQQVDGEFVSPFARDRETVGRATTELTREISVFERTAEKSFIAGRLLPTRELYQMILEQHPGHTPSLCKLGVVHLRLDDPSAAVDAFRRAVELDSSNAYAYRMLGFSFMQMDDLTAAEQAARQSVEIAPTDGKSQILLATLLYRLGRTNEAETHFKAAINADPMPSEPYYNLALLCTKNQRIDDARDYYQKALERGALPDPALEQSLANQ